MKKITLLIFLFLGLSITAQSISKQVIGTSGKTLTNSNLKVSYTVGEPVVGLMTAGGNQLGNGYYPSMDMHALSIDDASLNVQIKIYPNPTSQSIFITHPNLTTFQVKIADMNGKQLFEGTIEKDIAIDVSSYTQGIYLISIDNKESNKKNTYKIIKR